MDIDVLRDHALALKDVEECMPFGPDTLVFKVQGKIFLLISLNAAPLHFNVKCDPEQALELREQYSSVQPGYHMNKKHWNTITADGSLTGKQLKEMITHSYELVAPKTKKKLSSK